MPKLAICVAIGGRHLQEIVVNTVGIAFGIPGGSKRTVLKGFNRKFCVEKRLKYQITPDFEP